MKCCANCSVFPRQKPTKTRAVHLDHEKMARNQKRTPLSTGKLTICSDICLCGACGEIFQTERGFNLHRAGNHTSTRNCLDPDQMKQAGMVINASGRWGTCKYEVTQQQDTAA